MGKNEVELPIGRQDQESTAQVAAEFAALAVKIVLKETTEAPVLAVMASNTVRPAGR